MAAGKGKFQIVGTEKSLSQGNPQPSPSANPASGTWQVVGTYKDMERSSIQSPSANPRSGQWQVVGTEKDLSRSAVKGWGSAYKLSMSEDAIKQSQNVAERGSSKAKKHRHA